MTSLGVHGAKDTNSGCGLQLSGLLRPERYAMAIVAGTSFGDVWSAPERARPGRERQALAENQDSAVKILDEFSASGPSEAERAPCRLRSLCVERAGLQRLFRAMEFDVAKRGISRGRSRDPRGLGLTLA